MSRTAPLWQAVPLALAALAVMPGPALGQTQPLAKPSPSDPASFTLPEPSPSPRPAAQGPADEHAGVRINPRIIDPAQRAPQSSSPAAPPAASSPVTPPAASSTQAPATRSPSPAITPSPRAPAGRADAADGDRPSAPAGQNPLPADADEGYLVGEGEWVDVIPEPSIDLGQRSQALPPSQAGPQTDADAVRGSGGDGTWLWVALMSVLAGLALVGAGFARWRARRSAPPRIESNVTRGVLAQIAQSYDRQPLKPAAPANAAPRPAPPSPAPSAPAASSPMPRATAAPHSAASPSPDPAPEPARLALSLTITGARRSVMMFTLDYRLTIANRADRAVRDLTLSAQLTCAQRGASNAAPIARGQPMGQIERIGPSQSATLTATLQLPMVDVRMIRQGSVPVFIPLVHVRIEGQGQRANTTSFVVGTPSAENQSRLHPIALDGLPGGISGLRANRIAQAVTSEPA